MPYCRNCGNKLIEGARFCKYCGAPTDQVPPTTGVKIDAPDGATFTVSDQPPTNPRPQTSTQQRPPQSRNQQSKSQPKPESKKKSKKGCIWFFIIVAGIIFAYCYFGSKGL